MGVGTPSRRRWQLAAGAATVALLLGGCVYFPDSAGPLRDLEAWALDQDGVVDVADSGSELTNPANPFSGDSVGVATIVLDDDSDVDDVVRLARAVRAWADERPDDAFELSVDGPTGGVAVSDDDDVLDASLALVEQAADDPDVVGLDVELVADSLSSTVVVRRADDAPASRVWTTWADAVAARGLAADVQVVLPEGGTDPGRDGLTAAREASDELSVSGVRRFAAPSGAAGTIGPELTWLDALDVATGAPGVPGVVGWRVDTTDGGTADLAVGSRGDVDAVAAAARALLAAESLTALTVTWGDVVLDAGARPDAPARQLWEALSTRTDLTSVAVGADTLTAATADPGVGVALAESLAEVPGAGDVVLTLDLRARDGSGDGEGEVDVQGASAATAATVLDGLAALTDDPARVISYVRDDGAVDLYVDDRWTTQGTTAVTTALAGVTDGTPVSVAFDPVREDAEGEPWAASFVASAGLAAADLDVRAEGVDPAATRSRTDEFVAAWNRLR